MTDQCLYYKPSQIIGDVNYTRTTSLLPVDRTPYLSTRFLLNKKIDSFEKLSFNNYKIPDFKSEISIFTTQRGV